MPPGPKFNPGEGVSLASGSSFSDLGKTHRQTKTPPQHREQNLTRWQLIKNVPGTKFNPGGKNARSSQNLGQSGDF